MNDTYPQNFEIEIDRDNLRKYFRTLWLLSGIGMVAFLSTPFLAASISKRLEGHRVPALTDIVTIVATFIGIWMAAAVLVGLAVYIILSHRLASQFANKIELSVEGPFLRVRRNLWFASDRKLHFRSIVDYATVQGPLMRHFDVHALRMSTMAGGQASTFQVAGIKDCLKVRDLLAEIDRLRENQ